MGVTLTGKTIKDTYDGLLKFTDNLPVNINNKDLTDGYGNETGLALSTIGATAKTLYNLQTIAQIDADGSVKVVPTREWTLSKVATATSFSALTDTPSGYSTKNYQNVNVNSAGTGLVFTPSYYDFACGDETSDISVGNVINMEFPRAINRLRDVDFTVTTAPTGAAIVIDVLLNGTTVFTGVNRPTIDIGTTTTVNSSISYSFSAGNFNIIEGDVLTVEVTQVGSVIAGVALKAFFTYNENAVF